MNFQDVIRESYDSSNKALKVNLVSGTISASGQATVTLVNTPTIYAVVNTSAAGDSVNNIGFATVAISNPTLYAVVNTSAPGVSNSIVTVANPNFGIVGNVTIDSGVITSITNPVALKGNITISDSKGFIGLTTSVIGSAPTIFAVVNTSVAGVGNSIVTVANPNFGVVGNVTLSDSKTYIGLITVGGGFLTTYPQIWNGSAFEAIDNTKYIGLTTSTIGNNPILGSGVNNVGFATVAVSTPTLYAVVNTGAAGVGNSIVTVANPNFGINAGVNYIGFATVDVINAWPDPKTYIGLVTVANTVTVGAHGITGNITLSDAKTYIGLNTVTSGVGDRFIGLVTAWVSGIAGNVTLSDSKTYIGLNTITAGVGDRFIGLVTANAINVGTNKTLVILPVGLGNNSLATVAVPTNAQRIKVTNLILNSNITTSLALKSGVTYLTGNASLAVTLFPGGGFVLPGSPDSPSWIGLPSGALVVEKRDAGGTVANLTGHAIYFDET